MNCFILNLLRNSNKVYVFIYLGQHLQILNSLQLSAVEPLERYVVFTYLFVVLIFITFTGIRRPFELQVLLARHRKQGGYYAVKVLQKQMIIKRKEVCLSYRLLIVLFA